VPALVLFAATFTGTPDTFAPPYWDLSPLASVLVPVSEGGGPVQQLRAAGIKVLLSAMGPNLRDEHGEPLPGMGWAHVPPTQREAFAEWVVKEVLEKYGLDGVDIDNEYSNLADNPQGLVDTVAVLRAVAPNALIHKALYNDFDDFKTPVTSSSPPVYLGQMLDLASTMTYGARDLRGVVEDYVSLKDGDQDVGMKPSQLCIGVQAGVGPDKTTLPKTKAASEWVVEFGFRGMMLFTFTSDIQQWTHQPQNACDYRFPNPNDHEWQKAIVKAMGV